MAILKSCCCGKSLRSGSYASAIFTLAFYTVVLTAVSFHINTASQSIALLLATVGLLVCSACSVLSSVVLITGLCVDNRMLLLPWIVSISVTTTLDVTLCVYLMTDSTTYQAWSVSRTEKDELDSTLEMEEGLDVIIIILFAFDFMMCALNLYCLLCVVSQYQEYLIGRGYAGQDPNAPPQPVVRLQPSQPQGYKGSNAASYKNLENGLLAPSSATSGTASQHLLAPRPYVPSLRTPLELSSISEEPSSHDPAPKISTDDTSLDDEVSHTSSSFSKGGRTVYALPVPPLPTAARLARQEIKKAEASAQDKSHLLEGYAQPARTVSFVTDPSRRSTGGQSGDTSSRSAEEQQWI